MRFKYDVYIIVSLSIISIALFNRNRLTRYAKKWLGEREIKGNMGFENPKLQALMEQVNWDPGDQWCVYFVKMIWYNKFKEIKEIINKKVTGNSQSTYNNLKNDTTGLFSIHNKPKKDDIVIWQYYEKGNGTGIGHAGIVTSVFGSKFKTIQGNTSELGSISREGVTVAEKKYDLDVESQPKTTGLRLKGFLRYNYA